MASVNTDRAAMDGKFELHTQKVARPKSGRPLRNWMPNRFRSGLSVQVLSGRRGRAVEAQRCVIRSRV